jgi:hypothetical protein
MVGNVAEMQILVAVTGPREWQHCSNIGKGATQTEGRKPEVGIMAVLSNLGVELISTTLLKHMVFFTNSCCMPVADRIVPARRQAG